MAKQEPVVMVPADEYEAMVRVVHAVASGTLLTITKDASVLVLGETVQPAQIIWDTAWKLNLGRDA